MGVTAAAALRKTGISVVGDMPWGTHFCHFYETQEDLLDILIPYLRTGLEHNEFCMWVVSVPGKVDGARNVLKRDLPEAERHLAAGDIEIVPLSQWARTDETLDLQRVSNDWREKLAQALARGYAGMRVIGNAMWLTEEDWKNFSRFEKELNKLIAGQQMIVSCTYPLATSRADEVFDLARTHEFAIAKRNGAWEMIETPELKVVKAEIKRLNEELEQRVVERTRELAAANEELRCEIIEREQAEASQRENQRQYESLVQSIDGIVWEIDDVQSLKFTFVSRQAERLLGYPLERWLSEPNFWTEHLHPDDRKWAVDFCTQSVARRKAHQFEYRMIAADGRVVWLRDIVTVNVSDDNSVRLSGVLVDITESKHVEELNRTLLHDLTERVKELTALHEASLFLQREGLGIPAVLRELAALLPPAFQYPEIAAARIRLGQIEAATPQFAELPTVLRTGFTTVDEQPGSIEVVYLEDRRPAADEGSFLSEERTFVATFAELLRTFYDRRWAETALRESEERYRTLVKASSLIVWSSDAEGQHFLMPGWVELTGQSEAEAHGDGWQRMLHPDDRAYAAQAWAEGRQTQTTYEAEFRLRARDGSYHHVVSRAVPVVSEGRVREWIGALYDVTGRKLAEEQLKNSNEKLRALSASLQSAREAEGTRIAREIHDELGSTLTGLRWELESFDKLISAPGKNSPLRELQEKVAGMLRLTDTTISSVRRIASELRPSVLDDLGLLEAIEWETQQFQSRTGIICHCVYPAEEINLGQDRSTAVFRILQEALTNILRHAQATKIEISVSAGETGAFVLTLSDNGRGITEDEKSGAHSLGLLGMRERAHLVGASIEITGAAGKGTTVTVRVPTPGAAGI